MNLKKLFEMQKVLDDRIVKEKGLEGVDLLPMKILALQTELGECANEWRGFKFWSEDQKARGGSKYLEYGDPNRWVYKNPLLEEYVDCLHFILSIGNGIDYKEYDIKILEQNIRVYKSPYGVVEQFNDTFESVTNFRDDLRFMRSNDEYEVYEEMMYTFSALGETLGFTTEQIEQAYLDKNKVNHERQENSY